MRNADCLSICIRNCTLRTTPGMERHAERQVTVAVRTKVAGLVKGPSRKAISAASGVSSDSDCEDADGDGWQLEGWQEEPSVVSRG